MNKKYRDFKKHETYVQEQVSTHFFFNNVLKELKDSAIFA